MGYLGFYHFRMALSKQIQPKISLQAPAITLPYIKFFNSLQIFIYLVVNLILAITPKYILDLTLYLGILSYSLNKSIDFSYRKKYLNISLPIYPALNSKTYDKENYVSSNKIDIEMP